MAGLEPATSLSGTMARMYTDGRVKPGHDDRTTDESGSASIGLSVIEHGHPDFAPACRRQLRRPVPLTQELEELDTLAQPALQHLWATHHLAHDRRDLRRPEIEPLIEGLHVVEDLGV